MIKDPDNWFDGKRVLITGGVGFLGGWVIRGCLDRGATPIMADISHGGSVGRKLVKESDPVVRGYTADVRDDSIVHLIRETKPHAIIHLAGASHINASQSAPLAAFHTNAMGVLKVMEGAYLLKQDVLYPPHVVVASSNHVYGSHPGMSARTEEAPLNQLDIYGASKHCGDVMARSLGLALHVPTVALRHVNAYGPYNPHESHITNAAILAAIKGEPLRLRGDGSARKAYLSASDVADAYLALAKHADDLNVRGKAFNAAPEGHPPSVIEWVDTVNEVAESAGLKPQPPICLPAGQGEQVNYYEHLDAAELRKWTGWAIRVGFHSGIEKTIDYWLAQAR